jgi:hypothetical protein
MTVTAHLHAYAGLRCDREIGGHDRGRASVKPEGRLQHAAVANRQQIRDPSRARFDEDVDRIAASARRRPARVTTPGHLVTQRLAKREALRERAQPRSGQRDSSRRPPKPGKRHHFRRRARQCASAFIPRLDVPFASDLMTYRSRRSIWRTIVPLQQRTLLGACALSPRLPWRARRRPPRSSRPV